MKEQMMYWLNGDLVLTPNRAYVKTANRILITGILFLLLGLFLFIRFSDFWQLPLAIALCLGLPAFTYKVTIAKWQIIISPSKEAPIIFRLGKFYKRNILQKNEAEVVHNTFNGNVFFAIADKQNPYGKAYQISPFLNQQKRAFVFEKEVLPIVYQQLEI